LLFYLKIRLEEKVVLIQLKNSLVTIGLLTYVINFGLSLGNHVRFYSRERICQRKNNKFNEGLLNNERRKSLNNDTLHIKQDL